MYYSSGTFVSRTARGLAKAGELSGPMTPQSLESCRSLCSAVCVVTGTEQNAVQHRETGCRAGDRHHGLDVIHEESLQ